MVKTVYLIRHGHTAGDDKKRYKGSIDVPLSEKGVEQMKKTSVFLKDVSLSAVYCSPLNRALKSAEIIAEPHGLRPVIISQLRERSFGLWEGMTFNEIKDKYPEEFEAWVNNPLKYSPPEGESTIEVRDRAIEEIEKILSNHDNEKIAIVAHGGINRIILCHFLGTPLDNIFRIEQDYGAVNIIELYDRYPVIKLINGIFYG